MLHKAKSTVYESDLADKIKKKTIEHIVLALNSAFVIYVIFLDNIHFSNLKAVIDSHCNSNNWSNC